MLVLLDTDIGGDFDDANALAFLIGLRDVELVGVTTVGAGGDCRKRAKVASRVLRLAGSPDVSVYAGIDSPAVQNSILASLSPEVILNAYDESMVDEEISPVHAVEAMLKEVEKYGQDLTLIGIGACTNIAAAITRDRRIMQRVGRVILMAGAFRRQFREANVAIDPEAAKTVFESGLPIVAVGVEEASRSVLPLAEYQRDPFCRSDLGALLGSMASVYSSAYRTDSVTLYDVTAAAAAVRPEWFELEHLRVAVELEGQLTRGMTVVEQDRYFNVVPGASEVTVVRDHNAGAVSQSFSELVLEGDWPVGATSLRLES